MQPGTSWGGGSEKWTSGRKEAAPDGLPRTRPAPSRLRAGEDVPRSVEVGEAGAAAAGQRGEELQKDRVGCTGQRTEPFPPALPSSLSSGFRPGHQPYGSSPRGPPSHTVQGGVGAGEIQERQNIRTAQETVEALVEG